MTQTNDPKPSNPITAVIACSSFIQALSSIHISCAGKSSGIVIVPTEVAEALTAHLNAFDPNAKHYSPADVEAKRDKLAELLHRPVASIYDPEKVEALIELIKERSPTLLAHGLDLLASDLDYRIADLKGKQ